MTMKTPIRDRSQRVMVAGRQWGGIGKWCVNRSNAFAHVTLNADIRRVMMGLALVFSIAGVYGH